MNVDEKQLLRSQQYIEKLKYLTDTIYELEDFLRNTPKFDPESSHSARSSLIMTTKIVKKVSITSKFCKPYGSIIETITVPNSVRNKIIEYCEDRVIELREELKNSMTHG